MATIRKRGNRWQVQIRRKELPSISRSFSRKIDALEWAREMEFRADRFDLPAKPVNLKDMKLEDLVQRYMDEIITTKRCKEVTGVLLPHWPPPLDLPSRFPWMKSGSFSMETSLEFLTTRKAGREVHRHWPDEVKAKIVSESLRPGTTVNEVAQRYGLRANSLSTWRTMARQGKLILPAPEDALEFAAVIVDPPVSELPPKMLSRPEIIVGPVTIRLEEGASASRIASIARALAAAT